MEIDISKTPNAFARAPRIDISHNAAFVSGYQNYKLFNNECIPLDQYLTKRLSLLSLYFQPQFLSRKTFLDLGANGGFFSQSAAHMGAQVTCVEMDPQYVSLIQKVTELAGTKIILSQSKVERWNQKADVVNALALVHWLFSCTAQFGSLPKVVDFLAELTDQILFVEWVDPSDPAIRQFKHTSFNAKSIKGKYSRDIFIQSLQNRFEKVVCLGFSRQTREIFAAFKPIGKAGVNRIFIDLPCNRVTKFHAVTRNSLQEQRSDSEQLACDDFNSIAREAYWLKHLEGSGITPRLIHFDSGQESLLQTVVIVDPASGVISPISSDMAQVEQVKGRVKIISQYVGEEIKKETLPDNWQHQVEKILAILQRFGCSHNVIEPQDILVHEGHLSLIDFGWATRIDEPIPANWPADLGGSYRLGNHQFDDRHALFRSIEDVLAN